MQNARSPRAGTPRRGAIRLPGVSTLLRHRQARALLGAFGARLVTDLLRESLERLRDAARDGRAAPDELRRAAAPRAVLAGVRDAARRLVEARPGMVINATGVVVHTNLGRAVLSEPAARRLARDAGAYVDLEYDLATGERGSRLACLAPLMERLFPGAGYAVVNNNAAAILICLRALAAGREALVSRGELVEIGGSFRIPEILAAAGVTLREVGTTNRTRRGDYERALGPRAAVMLKVHPSNFRIEGFTEQVSVEALAALARRVGLPLVVDWGSGDLVDLAPLGMHDEVPAARLLAQGADLVTFSGDKLLGGPQAGFVVGRPDLVRRVARDPLARVCRIDRLRLGALQATLAAYVCGKASEEVPTLRLLGAGAEEIGARAARLVAAVASRASAAARRLEVVPGVSRAGGGSSPGGERPTRLIAVASAAGDARRIERRLRAGQPPVIARLQDGRVLLDLRTVLPGQEGALAERLADVLEQEP